MKKRENRKGKVYSVLKGKILYFELKPGERIQERELSQELGVSRTPIREALNRLEQEGFITTFPNRGYFVSDFTHREVEELYDIREVLECFAIQQAVKRGNKKDWDSLDKILLDESKKTKDQRFDIGRMFHEEIARISGNRMLQQMLATIFEKIHRARWIDIFFINRADDSFKEHLQILDCLKKGKADKAVPAAQRHIQHAKENILHLLERKKNLLYIK